MIKLLAIYPGMDERAEMLFSLQALKRFGVETIVITGRSAGLHGKGYRPHYDNYDSLKVFRIHRNDKEMFLSPWLHYDEILELSRDFDPDIILSSQQLTTRLAVKLAKEFKVPIVLWIESSAYDYALGTFAPEMTIKSRLYLRLILRLAGLPPTIIGWWNWLIRNCDAIITCNPKDKQRLKYLRYPGKIIRYIPWPIGLNMASLDELKSSKKKRGIYAGSLLSLKNIREFKKTIPQILSDTPTENFLFIGHGTEQKVVVKLHRQFGDRILYSFDMPKKEVAKLIAASWYAYTPARGYGSWQFIGDCWALGTPLITTYDSGYVENNHNGLIVHPGAIVPTVNRLFRDQKFYREIVEGGAAEANERHPKRIAMKLFSVLEECLNGHT